MSSKLAKFYLPIFLFCLTFFIYVHNLSRGVYGGDTGDLISAAVVLGIPHPPGYPFYTLLGFFLTRINLISPAFMVGLISVFSSAFSVLLFYLISLKLTKNMLASFIASLILSFNFLFWFYAEIAEVFSLNVFFTLILIYFALLFSENKKIKYLYILGFLTGLSLTNHQTIIFIFPTVLIIIFKALFPSFKKPKMLIFSLLFFVLGFSVYLYVPIASLFNPVVNWVPVNNIQSFLRLFLRSDYGTFNAGPFLAGGIVERTTVVKIYLQDLITQLTIPSILLIIIGFLSFLKSNKKVFTAILIGFLLSGPIFIGYADFPLLNAFLIGVNERFIIMSSVLVLLFLPFGLVFVSKLPQKVFNKRIYEKLFLIIFLIIPLSLLYFNFPKTDLSKITIGNDLAYDYLLNLPKNSFIILGGDTPLLNTWYVHYALNFRKDVYIVNINQLLNDKYYFNQRTKYLAKNPKEVKNPNLKLKVFEQIAKVRPVYAYDLIRPSGAFEKITWVPYGLVNKLFLPSETLPTKDDYLSQTAKIWGSLKYFTNLKKEQNFLALGNAGISDIPSQYSNALLLTGDYVLSQYQDEASALNFFNTAIKTSPSYYKNYQILGVYYLSQKKCVLARDNFEKAINIYPFDKDLYYFLYADYANCLKDKTLANKIISDYKKLFKSDFIKDVVSELKN